jgi:GTPase
MRFVDEVEIITISGKGGRGSSSFRREKYVAFGGPDGGDGGRGGHVVLVADPGLTTLHHLRHQNHWRAGHGDSGGTARCTGASGEDLRIPLPVGTVIRRMGPGGEVMEPPIFELLNPGEERVVAEGGKGGLGNVHFKTSTNRAPRKSTPGGPGETIRLRLELKLVADVGIIGFPNAGKSTFISTVSAARPRIADYPFTTLVPNLGVVSVDADHQFVIADIPGLIEGAAEGKGLGHQFLRHVERSRTLLHLVSLTDEGPPVERWRIVRNELARYSTSLEGRPEVLALTKADAVEPEVLEEALADFAAIGLQPLVLSAVTGRGVQAVVAALWSGVHAADPDRV